MADFVAFLANADEPVTLDEVKANSRIDADLVDDDDFIANVLIPSVRQEAEVRCGAAIKLARFVQRLEQFPPHRGAIALDRALVNTVERIDYAVRVGAPRVPLDLAQVDVALAVRCTLISPVAAWPQTQRQTRAVEVTFTAGLSGADMAARFPGVRYWMLLAATWGYASAWAADADDAPRAQTFVALGFAEEVAPATIETLRAQGAGIILLGNGAEDAPAGAHGLRLPLRPAKLRALLAQLLTENARA